MTAAKLAEQYIVNRGAIANLNNATTYGFYTYDATTQNTPTSYGSVIVVEGTGLAGNWIQLALGYSAGNVNPSVFVRFRQNLESWSSWVKIWKSNDFNPENYLPLSGGKTITGNVALANEVMITNQSGGNLIGLRNGLSEFGDAGHATRIVSNDSDLQHWRGGQNTIIYDSSNFNPSDYLSKENTTVYVPTGEYNPATKGYVDSAVENGSTKKVNTTNLNTLIS